MHFANVTRHQQPTAYQCLIRLHLTQCLSQSEMSLLPFVHFQQAQQQVLMGYASNIC